MSDVSPDGYGPADGYGKDDDEISMQALIRAANLYNAATFLRKALDVLDRTTALDGEAWVSAIRARERGLALVGRELQSASVADHLEVSYDRRLDELVTTALYRDVLRDNVQAALDCLRPG